MFSNFKVAQSAAQGLAAQAVVGAVRAQSSFKRSFGSMSRFERQLFLAACAFSAAEQDAFAQSGPAASLSKIKTTVISIGQVLFAIFLMIGLVKTAKKFIGGEPDAMTSLMWLVGGVLLFFGFSVLKTQIVGDSGGAAGGGTGD